MQESGEMYLETIYRLSQNTEGVHAINVGSAMGFSKPSVSRALGILKEEGHILINEENHIFLTESGLAIAQKIYDRHVVLTQFLVSLGVRSETAEADACKIEHVISDETLAAIKKHLG